MSGIWKILKYYEPLLLPNTTLQAMLLFVYNRSREIFGNAQENFRFTVEKKQTQASTFVTIFLRQLMEEMIDSFL